MKIAHIESSINWGGQELRTLEQMQWLLSNGHETLLIARPTSKIIEQARVRSLPVVEIDLRGSANPKTINQLCQLIRQEKPDILECHSNRDASYSAFTKWLLGQTVIRSRHITDPVKSSFFHTLLWKYGNDGITTTAKMVNQRILDKNLADESKIYVQEAGVDAVRFNPENRQHTAEIRKELNIPEDHIIIANVGMIRPDKGQSYFVEAAEQVLTQHPNATFIQVGEATSSTEDYKNKILKKIETAKNAHRIKFIGYRDAIEKYIALADIVVIASIGTEAKTRLVSQSFLSKTNVVATTTGGLPEMIEDKTTGLLCTPANSESLASAVLRLINSPELSEKLSRNAFTLAQEKLTTDGMMHGMLNMYSKSLNGLA